MISKEARYEKFIKYVYCGEIYKIMNLEFMTAIDSVIEELPGTNIFPDRHRVLIKMRWGLGEYDDPHTFKRLGLYFNRAPELLRQNLLKQYRRLRHPSRMCYLEHFFIEELDHDNH